MFNAGDSLTTGNPFATQDHGDYHGCARRTQGAWWYHWFRFWCYNSDLNGIYRPAAETSNGDRMDWSSFTKSQFLLKRTEMKIRPM